MESVILNFVMDKVLGPLGGALMGGLILGGVLAMRFLAPMVHNPRLDALEEQVQKLIKENEELESELEPFRQFMQKQALEALNPVRG